MKDKFDILLSQINQVQAAIKASNKTLQQISSKLSEHDRRFAGIEQKLSEHDRRFDKVEKRLDKVEVRLDRVEQRLDKVEVRLDKVEKRLDKVEQRLDTLTVYVMDGGLRKDLTETFVTKTEFESKMDQIIAVLDTHTQILKRLDQERLFTHERISRLEQKFFSN
jgi:chromosome segregation ATPase